MRKFKPLVLQAIVAAVCAALGLLVMEKALMFGDTPEVRRSDGE
jgi:hypothetical protein